MTANKTTGARPGLSLQAFWLIVARTAGFVFSLALPIVLARVFSQQDFGIYKQAFVVVTTAVTLLSCGLATSAFYYLSRLPEKAGSVVLNIVLYHFLAGTFGLLLFTFWPGLLKLLLGDDSLIRMAPLVGGIILVFMFGSFLESVATANADVMWSTVFIIMAQVSKALLMVGTAVIFHSVRAVLYGALAQGLLQSAILLFYLQKRFPGFARQFDMAMAKEQFLYAAPYGLAALVYTVQTDLHNYLASNRFSPAEYAIYAVGTAQLPFAGILRESVNSVMLPRVSKLQLEGNYEEIISLLFEAWRRLSSALFPACVLLLVLGQDFVTLLYQSRYLGSVPIFRLNLVLLVFAVFIADAIVRAFPSHNMYFLKLRVVALVAQIPVSLVATKWFGLMGPLIGVLLVTAFERVVNLTVLLKMLDFGPRHYSRFSSLAGFAAASALAGVATWLALAASPLTLPLVRGMLGGSLFAVVYLVSVVKLKLLTPAERAMVNRATARITGRALLA